MANDSTPINQEPLPTMPAGSFMGGMVGRFQAHELEHLNEAQKSEWLKTMGDVHKGAQQTQRHNMSLFAGLVALVVVAVVVLLLFGRPDIYPVVRELLIFSAGVLTGGATGVVIAKKAQQG